MTTDAKLIRCGSRLKVIYIANERECLFMGFHDYEAAIARDAADALKRGADVTTLRIEVSLQRALCEPLDTNSPKRWGRRRAK